MSFITENERFKSIAIYLLIGSAVFAVGLVWHFPLERIKNLVTSSIAQQTRIQIDMDELSFSFPLGLEAKEARISGIPYGRQKKDARFKTLEVSLSPGSALLYPFRKSVSLEYDVEHEGTKWQGEIAYSPEEIAANGETENWKIRTEFSLDAINPMLTGSNAKLRASVAAFASFAGKTSAIKLSDFSAADGSIKLMVKNALLEAPVLNQFRFDSIEVLGVSKEGKVDVQSVKFLGPDLNGTMSGSIKLMPLLPRSQLDLNAKFTLSEKKRQDLATLLPVILSQANLRMDDNGTIAIKIRGDLTRVRASGY